MTTPSGVILRMSLLPYSATYTLPDESTATPAGASNVAAVPVPLAFPGAPVERPGESAHRDARIGAGNRHRSDIGGEAVPVIGRSGGAVFWQPGCVATVNVVGWPRLGAAREAKVVNVVAPENRTPSQYCSFGPPLSSSVSPNSVRPLIVPPMVYVAAATQEIATEVTLADAVPVPELAVQVSPVGCVATVTVVGGPACERRGEGERRRAGSNRQRITAVVVQRQPRLRQASDRAADGVSGGGRCSATSATAAPSSAASGQHHSGERAGSRTADHYEERARIAHMRLRRHTKVIRGYPGGGDSATLKLATVSKRRRFLRHCRGLYSDSSANFITD